MSKINVIYWSGTGNTEMMANAIADGTKEAGNEVNVIHVGEATIDDANNCDVLVLGCSSMGDEVLEEGEMEPYMESIDGKIGGKKIALFGSYGWGDGRWMREWQERVEDNGAILLEDGLILNETPDDEGLAQCREFGKRL
ncbi:flavodoxin [Oceanirhabdus seepicola]|uniref:Flavodoxin n=1 Tax=Oceanirhabdus seepicola TaxID=2828781 RepID=A0A9J6P2R1_9CLOT|nr:flavodoxin [Oceanirhabdus seepicola]MCM1990353.1 flavodoxin [Oceanirhabdus seepicola]